MKKVKDIRDDLIDKILSINNKEYLIALDHLITASSIETMQVGITKEQKWMLEMSEKDIKEGKLISQEAMMKRNLEWLEDR